MWWYVAIAAVCAGLVPWARKRSEGSMTRYSVGTGAPIVIVLIGAAALVAAFAHGSGDGDLARELFTGGLIGGALAQFILVRRTYGITLRPQPLKTPPVADGAAERDDDPDAEPDPRRAVPTD
jgi:hypothetical protein